MDQEKIGKFICECRKKKNITQVELAEKLLVSNRAVSKWEKGKSMPDVLLFNPLCEILEISVNELLNGENNKEDDKQVIEAIKYYNSKVKRRFYIILGSIFIIAVVTILSIYMINNYNKCRIYTIDTNNEEFFVNGYLMINQQSKILTINRLDYNFDYSNKFCGCTDCVCPDILVENMKIKVLEDNITLEEIEFDEVKKDGRYLSDTIKNVTIDLNDLDTRDLKNLDNDRYRIVISYDVYKDNTVYDINLDVGLELHEIYANNKMFY